MPFHQFLGGVGDQSGTFTVGEVTLTFLVAFLACAFVGWVYRATHRGVSYSQSYVQTLVLLGMVVSLVMLVVGSNLARAFSLVGALSIIRFRNAVKETRDVGFLFFAMAIGMAAGTRFFVLTVIATVVISLVVLVMSRFEWYRLDARSQIVKVQVPVDRDYHADLTRALDPLTTEAQLVSVETVRAGALVEMLYSVRLRGDADAGAVMRALAPVAGGQKVTVLTGFDRSDL